MKRNLVAIDADNSRDAAQGTTYFFESRQSVSVGLVLKLCGSKVVFGESGKEILTLRKSQCSIRLITHGRMCRTTSHCIDIKINHLNASRNEPFDEIVFQEQRSASLAKFPLEKKNSIETKFHRNDSCRQMVRIYRQASRILFKAF